MSSPKNSGALFACVVTFCLVLIGWWIFFLVRESYYFDSATQLITEGKIEEAWKVMGADSNGDFTAKARRLRVMFTAEGIVMGLLVIGGVVMLYRSILRENRLRRQQEHFLTGATHHLKTPLATVRLGIESMLAGSMPDNKREKYLESMLREVDHLEKDLTNLLTAGGLQLYGDGLTMVVSDLSEDVQDAIRSMSDRMDAAGISLSTNIETGLNVRRDREAIHLILHNLLDNAVKYSPPESHIALSLTRAEDSAQLTITDTGRGIPASELPLVFDRFFRGKDGDFRGGSGIGLFLVRELVHSHGGSITVTSEGAGTGAQFSVLLPLTGKESA
ncbi:MAG: HAMP domain-containing sensor histidine kinase [Planctomycetota bacterium]|nr:HAMP domain-containing sensor histidine kinase [Planctomycetota bacterium]